MNETADAVNEPGAERIGATSTPVTGLETSDAVPHIGQGLGDMEGESLSVESANYQDVHMEMKRGGSSRTQSELLRQARMTEDSGNLSMPGFIR